MKTTFPRETKATRRARFYDSMSKMGFTYTETETLRRAQITLHTWAEAECNGEIQRDETTDKPRRYYGRDMDRSYPTADREKGALRRIDETLAARNDREPSESALMRYHQTDPRGCALYLVPVSELRGQDISAVYSRGFGVCVD